MHYSETQVKLPQFPARAAARVFSHRNFMNRKFEKQLRALDRATAGTDHKANH